MSILFYGSCGEDLGAASERDYRLFGAYLDSVDAGALA